MIDQALEHLVNNIEEERKAIIDSLGDGSAKDYAQYQNAVGKLRGLLIAQIHIKNLAQHMENDDE
tara:strand:- start:4118 stop:4312 length:195 start_codon:yes stop_codon:yes gene_type:complete